MSPRDEGLLCAQEAFSRALLEPGLAVPEELKQLRNATSTQTATKRFDVYRNNVVTTLVDALRESFPTVRALVGDEFFAAVCRSYLDVELPSTPVLFQYGYGFGAFLDGFPPVRDRVPYLGDVARLEYARLQAYHSQDAEPLGIDTLSQIDPALVARVRLVPHPSLAIVKSDFPVVSLYGATNGLLDADQVDMTVGETALVIRPALVVNTALLPEDGVSFLEALIKGNSLAQAAELATQTYEMFDLSMHLSSLFQEGAFISIELSD